MMFQRCSYCLNRIYLCYLKTGKFKLHYSCIRLFYDANKNNPSITNEDLEKLKKIL
jgi:hypothetical protein